ncbi:MAG: DMT family transporter [Candidatus Methanomethylophilaceae archaeon]|nr:DMT family transporter [Candidatus Methanomethylophilaceae archaeon]
MCHDLLCSLSLVLNVLADYCIRTHPKSQANHQAEYCLAEELPNGTKSVLRDLHLDVIIGKTRGSTLALFGGFKLLSDLTLFNAQNNITLCLATLLQMTAPYFVMIFSMFLFKEKLTLKKMIAMAVGSVGCVLVTGILFGEVDANTEGVISAILSGLFFGMFFIGNRVAVDRDIRPGTTLFYTTVFADLIALPFINHADVLDAVIDPKGAVMALSLGILMTLIPYYLITWSSLHLEPAISSMISTLEVGAAAVVGYVVFRDVLTVSHVIGIVLVLSSIIVVNAKIRTEYIKRYGKYISPLHKFRLKAFGRDEDV